MGKTDKQGRTNRNESDNLKRNGSRKQVPSSYDGEGEGFSPTMEGGFSVATKRFAGYKHDHLKTFTTNYDNIVKEHDCADS